MNLEKLEEKKKKNIEQRREFVKQWANYVKNNPDKKWSKQQNTVINAQIKLRKETRENKSRE